MVMNPSCCILSLGKSCHRLRSSEFFTYALRFCLRLAVIKYSGASKFVKEEICDAENRRLCGRCYDRRYLDYICVDEMGKRLSPNYLSAAFPRLLEVNGLRHIRFHDLRHSCASLLLANGVPMKQIQEWLGHSDFSTTANIYAHLDYSSKLSSAEAMIAGLSGALNQLS